MIWGFRVDTDKNIGGGHAYRSICLAQEMKKTKDVIFFVNSRRDRLSKKIIDSKFKIDVLKNLNNYNLYGCILDGYEFEKEEISLIRSKVDRLIQIYDYGDIYNDCDLIVSSNKNFFNKKYKKKSITGFEYALINPKFSYIRREVQSNVKNVFIGFGLVDSRNFTSQVLEIIKESKLESEFDNIYVAMNSESKFSKKIHRIKESMNCKVVIKQFGDEIFDILKNCDLSIGSGGIGMCERLCSGIPSLVIVSADNQREIVEEINKEKAIINCGSYRNFDKIFFLKSLKNILTNFKKRKIISNFSKKIFDGNGVYRVSREIDRL